MYIVIDQVRKWCNGTWLQCFDQMASIAHLNIDSRNLDTPADSLFIAIRSHSRDGHDFVPVAYRAGVRNFLVSNRIDFSLLPDANILLVPDTVIALQQIAAGHRRTFEIPVVGITGSNGKTIVKEWLYHILGQAFNAIRSPKSYNSQIGVPLSVWQLSEDNRLGIFEAGISRPGEMEALSRIILPAIGIFTNIGEAHSEGFLNERQKINEKLLLFRNARKLVYCRDHAVLHESILQFLHQIGEDHEGGNPVLYGWSCKHEDAEFYISDVVRIGGKTHLTARWQEREITAAIPFTDDASVENAIHCWCTSLLLGCDEDVIRAGMSSLQPVSMRLELRQGINDCTLINDAYNSDLTSLGLALSYLARQQQSVHTVILSDILEVRHREYELYEEVAALLKRYPVRRFIGIGPALFKSKHFFRSNPKLRSIFFKSTEDFIRNFHILTFDNEAILLKGARVFTFEKIAALLEQRVHQTVMTVDLPALRHNLDVFRSYLQPGVRTMAMVKAFAYGSGSREIAGLLQQAGVDYLTVAYTDEGVGLRKAGIHMPIMVMSPDVSSFDRMIAWKLEPELYNFRSFEAFVAMAANLKVTGYPVHVKLDTGMHRLGFGPSDMDQVVLRIHSCPEITIASIFTHLAAADDADMDAFTARQGELFKTMYRQLTELLDYKPLRHLCNSAGIIRHPDLHFDMVRPGIGLYGIDSSGEAGNRLMQISSLRSSVAQVRVVDAGESIGYGHDVILPEKRTIATICIGYADGYPRSLGRGRAYVTIRGFRANIIGSVCMDMCMADVTEVPGVSEGDEVTIFGKDPSVNQLAQWAGTIPYEIMTGISQRVKRIYVNEE